MMRNSRLDHDIIFGIVEPGSKVLDLGCGDGDLLFRLARDKNALVRGIECNQAEVHACVRKGLSVLHGNIEGGLAEYPGGSFDYVILNQSMQEVRKVDCVIQEARRIGGRVIVGFPNFAHWSARLTLFLRGRTPINEALPYYWFETPNVRFLTIRDFIDYCTARKITIEQCYYLGKRGRISRLPNWRAQNAVFVLTQ